MLMQSYQLSACPTLIDLKFKISNKILMLGKLDTLHNLQFLLPIYGNFKHYKFFH